MKKNPKKLQLAKETLSSLDSKHLGDAVGGWPVSALSCVTCPAYVNSGCSC